MQGHPQDKNDVMEDITHHEVPLTPIMLCIDQMKACSLPSTNRYNMMKVFIEQYSLKHDLIQLIRQVSAENGEKEEALATLRRVWNEAQFDDPMSIQEIIEIDHHGSVTVEKVEALKRLEYDQIIQFYMIFLHVSLMRSVDISVEDQTGWMNNLEIIMNSIVFIDYFYSRYESMTDPLRGKRKEVIESSHNIMKWIAGNIKKHLPNESRMIQLVKGRQALVQFIQEEIIYQWVVKKKRVKRKEDEVSHYFSFVCYPELRKLVMEVVQTILLIGCMDILPNDVSHGELAIHYLELGEELMKKYSQHHTKLAELHLLKAMQYLKSQNSSQARYWCERAASMDMQSSELMLMRIMMSKEENGNDIVRMHQKRNQSPPPLEFVTSLIVYFAENNLPRAQVLLDNFKHHHRHHYKNSSVYQTVMHSLNLLVQIRHRHITESIQLFEKEIPSIEMDWVKHLYERIHIELWNLARDLMIQQKYDLAQKLYVGCFTYLTTSDPHARLSVLVMQGHCLMHLKRPIDDLISTMNSPLYASIQDKHIDYLLFRLLISLKDAERLSIRLKQFGTLPTLHESAIGTLVYESFSSGHIRDFIDSFLNLLRSASADTPSFPFGTFCFFLLQLNIEPSTKNMLIDAVLPLFHQNGFSRLFLGSHILGQLDYFFVLLWNKSLSSLQQSSYKDVLRFLKACKVFLDSMAPLEPNSPRLSTLLLEVDICQVFTLLQLMPSDPNAIRKCLSQIHKCLDTISSIREDKNHLEAHENALHALEVRCSLASKVPVQTVMTHLRQLLTSSSHHFYYQLVIALSGSSSYDSLLRLLSDHFSQLPVTFVEQFHFYALGATHASSRSIQLYFLLQLHSMLPHHFSTESNNIRTSATKSTSSVVPSSLFMEDDDASESSSVIDESDLMHDDPVSFTNLDQTRHRDILPSSSVLTFSLPFSSSLSYSDLEFVFSLSWNVFVEMHLLFHDDPSDLSSLLDLLQLVRKNLSWFPTSSHFRIALSSNLTHAISDLQSRIDALPVLSSTSVQ